MSRILNLLPLGILAWGVLAFGGVYPWAYVPLLVAACLSGGWEMWRGRSALSARPIPALGAALLFFAAASAVQIVPISTSLLNEVSPSADSILRQYELGYSGAASPATHPLSIDPAASVRGLFCIVALGMFLMGLTVRIARRGARDLVTTVTVLGALVSLIAIVQRAAGTDLVYGFWAPDFHTMPYGPFVNRNHFAGWVLMALPLVLGGAWARFHRYRVKPGWRNRLVWLGSADANQLLLIAFVAIVMALALVLSLSRSGAAAMAIIIVILFGAASRVSTRRARGWLAAYALLFVAVAFGWGSTQELGARFTDARRSFEGRVDVWDDALRVARAFPATGTGLNTYGKAMLFYQRADLNAHYEQAHNDYLQLAAEGGVLLCVPALTLLAVLAGEAWRGIKGSGIDGTRAGALVGVGAILVQEAGDFSLQMPGNAVLFCLLCAIVVHSPLGAVRATIRTV